jgi:hypothetical protein
LVNAYNNQKAIYGVHQQVLYLIALDKAFKERFAKSPISNEENTVFGLSGKIIYLKILKHLNQPMKIKEIKIKTFQASIL